MRQPLPSLWRIWSPIFKKPTSSSLPVVSQRPMNQMVLPNLSSISCSMKKCGQPLMPLSPKAVSSSVSVMVSKPWSNQVSCLTETLRMPMPAARPSFTMMPTSTWPRWWKPGLPMLIRHGWREWRLEISMPSQSPTGKENLWSPMRNLFNCAIRVRFGASM